MKPNASNIIELAQSLPLTLESVDKLYNALLRCFELESPVTGAHLRRGRLITVEGHSGSGKDTQIKLLEKHLSGGRVAKQSCSNVVSIVLKRHDPFREIVKSLWADPGFDNPAASFLLLSAGRKYVNDAVVSPLLKNSGVVVLQNRSFISHIAYHAGANQSVHELLSVCEHDLQPDLALVLTCDTNLAEARIRARAEETGRQIYVNETSAFIDRVKPHFQQLGSLVQNIVFVDTGRDIQTAARQIERHVERYFGER